MMAGLVQEQASVAQPGTKDDFADTIRRVRQVNVGKRTWGRWFRSTISELARGALPNFSRAPRAPPNNSSCSQRANTLTLNSRDGIAERADYSLHRTQDALTAHIKAAQTRKGVVSD